MGEKMKRNLAIILLSFTILFLLQACVTQTKRANLPDNLPDSWAAEVQTDALPITGSLMDLIDDPRLEVFIKEAMNNNHNLRATALRLKATGYLLTITRSRLWPTVNAGFSKGRDNQGVDPLTGKRLTENRHRISINVSWELDLWGRLADEHAAARLNYKAQAQEYIHAQDSLAARLVQAWINAIADQQAIRIEQERVKALESIEKTLVRRFRQGLGSLDELATAKTRTEVARADLSAREEAFNSSLRVLEVLLGRHPRAKLLAVDKLPVVIEAPACVPVSALQNRPDIQAALHRIGAAEKFAGAAQKARLPEIRLFAQRFKKSVSLGSLTDATTAWSVLGSLMQPIFEGGRLIDESKARTLEVNASVADLYQTILQALKEVENAFGREKDLAKQESALAMAMADAKISRRYFEQRYRDGLDSILNLLIAREQEITIKLRSVAVHAARLSNRVDLALALGIGLHKREADPEYKL